MTKQNPTKAEILNNAEKEKQELLLQLQALMDENEALKSSKEDSESSGEKFVSEQVHPQEYIQVVSLCPHILNLRAGRSQNAEQYRFETFGETARILYSDLALIISANKKFTRGGYFYILDERVVRNHGLEDNYSNVLKKEEIEKVFIEEPSIATEIFQKANDSQKTLLAEMIVNKVADGENVDMNLVRFVGDALGRDLLKDAESFKVLEK